MTPVSKNGRAKVAKQLGKWWTRYQQVEDCVEWTPIPPTQDQSLRERFRNVIRLAGYGATAAENILDQWYDFYMNGDRASFIKMLEDYEKNDGDPMEEEGK